MSADRWRLALDLYERGNPQFVTVVRTVHDAATLAEFAGTWFDDSRPEARRLLLSYLEQPLNAFRHEGLIKRLFKRAEATGDDAALARLMVTLDRALDRRARTRYVAHAVVVATEADARQREAEFRARGLDSVNAWRDASGGFRVVGIEPQVQLTASTSSTMPRDELVTAFVIDAASHRWVRRNLPEWVLRLSLIQRPGFDPDAIDPSEHSGALGRYRLFSVRTRQYLRRRCWRYFRRLGRSHPDRYVAALTEALCRYEDADFAGESGLLDRWSLVHALFHHSKALQSDPVGWRWSENQSINDLQPAPLYPEAWAGRPEVLVDLIERAGSRPVRLWALRLALRDPAAVRGRITPERLLGLLDHRDPEVVALAADWLRASEGLEAITPRRWLNLLATDHPEALTTLCELAESRLDSSQFSVEEALDLACRRPVPVARLGLGLLQGRQFPTLESASPLLRLLEAGCEPLRPELLRYLKERLMVAGASAEVVLEFLDSRRADARAVGLSWLADEGVWRSDVSLWQRLLESPHDEVRQAVLAELERNRGSGETEWMNLPALQGEPLRRLWATVLLNVHRGSRAKPVALRQVVRRLESRPDEAESLLPLIAVALRSTRGPEWRAGLAALVTLAERRPELRPPIERAFPELSLPALGA